MQLDAVIGVAAGESHASHDFVQGVPPAHLRVPRGWDDFDLESLQLSQAKVGRRWSEICDQMGPDSLTYCTPNSGRDRRQCGRYGR